MVTWKEPVFLERFVLRGMPSEGGAAKGEIHLWWREARSHPSIKVSLCKAAQFSALVDDPCLHRDCGSGEIVLLTFLHN